MAYVTLIWILFPNASDKKISECPPSERIDEDSQFTVPLLNSWLRLVWVS